MKNTGYILVTVEFKREKDGQWSAVCRELGTAACGDSFEEAAEAIHDLLALHLNALEEHGERERFFKKHGITLHSRMPRATRQVSLKPGTIVQQLTERVPVAAMG